MSTTQWSPEFDEILRRHLPLQDGPIDAATPLADLGLDSLGTVSLVMELEEALGIAIPDELLVPDTFASAQSLWSAVAHLMEEPAVA